MYHLAGDHVDLLIEAIARLEIEDGLRTEVFLGGWLHLAQDQFQNHLGVWVVPGDSVVVIETPVRPNSDSAEFRTSVVFKLQLLLC